MILVRRGPGLMRTMARTAVVAGTATAVSRGVSNSMDKSAAAKQEQQQAEIQAQIEAAQTQAAQTAMAANANADMTSKLKELADLKSSGALTEEEFIQAKQKLIAG